MKPVKDGQMCIQEKLENICRAQKEAERMCGERTGDPLLKPMNRICNNTIPLILYMGRDAFRADGVTTYVDQCDDKEKYYCFSTFLFRLCKLEDGCAVLELLRFKKEKGHCDSPCGQIQGQEVCDLMRTCVYVTVDLTCICALKCLPAARL